MHLVAIWSSYPSHRPGHSTMGLTCHAPEGAPVHATAAGGLLRVQRNGPGGLELIVQHNDFVGVYSRLSALAPKLGAGGDVLLRGGEQLGAVGRTGASFGAHLYFAMLRNGRAVDPAPFLGIPLWRESFVYCAHGSAYRSDETRYDHFERRSAPITTLVSVGSFPSCPRL